MTKKNHDSFLIVVRPARILLFVATFRISNKFPSTYTLESKASNATKRSTIHNAKPKLIFCQRRKKKKINKTKPELEYKRTLIDARTDGMTEFMMHAAGFFCGQTAFVQSHAKKKMKKKRKKIKIKEKQNRNGKPTLQCMQFSGRLFALFISSVCCFSNTFACTR